ncbi:hypothetical protein P3449_22105 [Vibrio parahaemolyticus]|uniref:hypothetical protein n=1 Tax=Vibrio parahaemolyticus TaxID=670 RepID=UPI0011223DCB|nr:hypothetical protein [Vibrio parahaemolyticus]MDF4269333.1 hypothetical protein [Vibrio parahaemolyticus]MDF4299262.1 hypothetical protein [Vibrio parahaemolyticus]TNZ88260.1 hypothetical protein CGK40_22780 [Vibrio parahaemolyticus]
MFTAKPNPKMTKRLEWIDKNDELLTLWLVGYIQQHSWEPKFNSDCESTTNYLAQFIEKAHYWEESAQTREQCRNMKSAWKSWKKREDNRNNKTIAEGNYTISMTARKELEQLAKRHNCSFSKVIENLLLNAKEIEHLQKEINKPLKKANHGYRVNTNFLATFFADDKAHQQAEIMTQALKQEIENNKKQHRKELEKLKQDLKSKQ